MTDRPLKLMNGIPMLFVLILFYPALFAGLIFAVVNGPRIGLPAEFASLGGFAIALVVVSWFFLLFGFLVVSPNQVKVVQLFGKYVGTVSDVGLFYGNPFYLTTRVSQRVRTFETGVKKTEQKKDAAGNVTQQATQSRQPLKVNDKEGTPIDIAAVVVWKVVNPAMAVFAVEDYEEFVETQADAALRNLASRYSYDAPDTDAHSLRGHIDEVAEQLRKDLHDRMHTAGVEMTEARISYLAYAPEIASAMLQRQQAGAVIAARARIVEGAVGMVEHALELLKEKGVIEFDADRKAAMVSNLLVVLCSHSNPQPVLNTGTIYS